MPRVFTTLVVLLAVFCCPISGFAQESEGGAIPQGPSYVVDLNDADDHYATVTMTVTPTEDVTELMMATWTPGSYLIREYAKHIDKISAENDEGALKIVKTKKNRWLVESPDSLPITITYRIFCNEVSVRTNFADNTHCVLCGAATFITLPSQVDRPHNVRLLLPKAWNDSGTSLHRIETVVAEKTKEKYSKDKDESENDEEKSDEEDEKQHFYRADNYDELVDSPIVAGKVEVYPFEVGGVPHYLVNVNDEGGWDGEKAAKDLAKVVEAHHEMWGEVPYDRYYFLNVINNSGGGLEHDFGCLMMSSQRAMRNEGSYTGWLSLCSHEFFHTWNVRRLRPKALVKYDYENEVYTPSLWVAEGVTSYYEDLLLVRAGLMEPDQFIGGLGGVIRGVENRDGRKVQSLRDSSHDAWIKFYRPEANSRDTQVSYYRKGSLAAFLLDIEIRSASEGKKSLDDVMRFMYQNFASVGYTPEDFRKACTDMAGKDLSDWFAASIDGTDDLAYQNMADWLGMQVGEIIPSNADQDDIEEPELRPWIGIGDEGSPATEAGVSSEDEIIAVNGRRFEDNLDRMVRRMDVGDEITLLVARDKKIQEFAFEVGGEARPIRWDLKKWDAADEVQLASRKMWLMAKEKPPEPPKPEVIYKWSKEKPLPIQ